MGALQHPAQRLGILKQLDGLLFAVSGQPGQQRLHLAILERLAELFAALQAHGMEPKRLQLVQHGPDKAPSAALLEAVRQGRPGLAVLPTLLNT